MIRGRLQLRVYTVIYGGPLQTCPSVDSRAVLVRPYSMRVTPDLTAAARRRPVLQYRECRYERTTRQPGVSLDWAAADQFRPEARSAC